MDLSKRAEQTHAGYCGRCIRTRKSLVKVEYEILHQCYVCPRCRTRRYSAGDLARFAGGNN